MQQKLKNKRILTATLFILLQLHLISSFGQQPSNKGRLLYSNTLKDIRDTSAWIMEGKGKIEFNNGWMHMLAPDKKGHAVFWCPQTFPSNFIAEWEVQNLHVAYGLCIVFFAAKGINGEDIFDPTIPKRDAIFKEYTNGSINNYHISYYANSRNERGRETANLRKNKGFYKVQSKESGIPINSEAVHKIQLLKNNGRIQMFIDERKIIDWFDEGQKYGRILEDGRIGFREMKGTQFAYRNFNVWEYVVTEK